MTTIKVEYIGTKEFKEDNVSDSGAIWEGEGDIQEVTPAQWGKLAKHPGVWRRVVDKPEASVPLSLGAKAETAQVDKPVQKPQQTESNLPPEAGSATAEQVAAAKFNFPAQVDGDAKKGDKAAQPGASKDEASPTRGKGSSKGAK